MIHVHLQEYEDAFLMLCGTVIPCDEDGRIPDGEDFVGTGRGTLKDGTINTAAQAAAMVDCPGCVKMFKWFNDGKELPR